MHSAFKTLACTKEIPPKKSSIKLLKMILLKHRTPSDCVRLFKVQSIYTNYLTGNQILLTLPLIKCPSCNTNKQQFRQCSENRHQVIHFKWLPAQQCVFFLLLDSLLSYISWLLTSIKIMRTSFIVSNVDSLKIIWWILFLFDLKKKKPPAFEC